MAQDEEPEVKRVTPVFGMACGPEFISLAYVMEARGSCFRDLVNLASRLRNRSLALRCFNLNQTYRLLRESLTVHLVP